MENSNVSTGKETAKDAFLHLLSAATIYMSVIGFIALWWQIVNFLVPDKLNQWENGSGTYMTMIWATSMLAVTFPVHILVSWFIGKDMRANPAKREVGVRKWLWYITLFVSAITMIIDLVILIFNFLRGDLSTQFFLKLVVVLAAAGAVFGYYLWDLRKRNSPSDKPKKIAWAVAVVMLASVVFGFSLFGSPAKQRDSRFDEQRVGNLQEIQNSVASYWQQKKVLPADLSELSFMGYVVSKDQETGKPYEYSVTGDLSFEICAEFKTVLSEKDAEKGMYYYYVQAGLKTVPQKWVHGAERTCFQTTIDPDFFKDIKEFETEKTVPAVPAD
ncbi:MAG: DUF5671 domain-containing protein [Candidatus Paceibacterota bacterium]|jgi:hypothetical protein